MNLYIETENGQCKNHPAFGGNLLQAFGSIPSNWEPFERVLKPELTVYQTIEGGNSKYEKVDGVWKDVWVIRDMTAEEKLQKQQETLSAFRGRPQAENWSAWTLNEETCVMVPPIPRPNPDKFKLRMGVFTYWCGAENNWKHTPPYPVDENQYNFDFIAWQWVQVVN